MCNWDGNTEQAKVETENRNRLLFKHLGSVAQRLKFEHLSQRQIVWTGPFSRVGEHLQSSPSHYFKRPPGSLVHSRKRDKGKKKKSHDTREAGASLTFPDSWHLLSWLMKSPLHHAHIMHSKESGDAGGGVCCFYVTAVRKKIKTKGEGEMGAPLCPESLRLSSVLSSKPDASPDPVVWRGWHVGGTLEWWIRVESYFHCY